MGRLAHRDVAAICELSAELDTVRVGATPVLRTVLPALRGLLGIEAAAAIELRRGPDGPRVAWSYGDRWPAHVMKLYTDFMHRSPAPAGTAPRVYSDMVTAAGAHDPTSAPPAQRNRAVDALALLSPREREEHPSMQYLWRPAGYHAHHQPRVLVCDGPSVLAWVGGFHPEPITVRQLAVLNALVPALRRRLVLDRRLACAERITGALEAALGQLATPAFVVGADATVHETNPAGLELLRHRNREVRAALADAIARRAGTIAFDLVPLRTSEPRGYWLALVRPETAVDGMHARLATAATRWRLTPREREVASWIAQGATNQRIAVELGCAESTVESHVTKVLAKADVASRSQMIAAVVGTR